MRIFVYPYQMYSEGASNIADGLGVLKLKPDSSIKLTPADLVINWGCSVLPVWTPHLWLNHPTFVEKAINKQRAFECFKLKGVSIPPVTTSYEEAITWFSQKNAAVVQRQLLTSNSGKGIKLALTSEELEKEKTKLYVKYIPKSAEYRVHIFQENVIDIQEKRKKNGWKENEKYSSKIRSHKNGWVFCRDNIAIPEKCLEEAIKAVASLNLDFGAVDVIYNTYKDTAYVLEVNTSPGIEGETMFSYVTTFLNYRESL